MHEWPGSTRVTMPLAAAEGSSQPSNEGGSQMVFETLKVNKEGAVLFAEIAAPPMNLLGPETGARSRLPHSANRARRCPPGARVQERRPRLFHFPRRRDPDKRISGRGGEADRRARRSVRRPTLGRSKRGRGHLPVATPINDVLSGSIRVTLASYGPSRHSRCATQCPNRAGTVVC